MAGAECSNQNSTSESSGPEILRESRFEGMLMQFGAKNRAVRGVQDVREQVTVSNAPLGAAPSDRGSAAANTGSSWQADVG